MQFSLIVKSGPTTLSAVTGRLADVELTPAEQEKVIETEQFLEKLLGFRVHINPGRPVKQK